MATPLPNPIELSFLAACTPAVAQTGVPEWDTAFAAYLRLAALQAADMRFGAYAAAVEAYGREAIQLTERFGRDFAFHPEGMPLNRAAFASLREAEDARTMNFLDPYWKAAEDLMNVPAPNVTAALYKADLIAREDLHLSHDFEPMDIVSADMARLAAQPVEKSTPTSARQSLEDIAMDVEGMAFLLSRLSQCPTFDSAEQLALYSVAERGHDIQRQIEALAA